MPRGMMTMQRGKQPEVTLACLLLAAAGCFADLNEVPQVTVQPSSTVQKLGGTVILGCVVEPPWMNTTWRLNGRELNGSDDSLGILITRGTLVVTALNNHTVGRYQCVARMPAGAVASVPATVTLANLQDFKLDVQHVIEVDEGNTAVIACHLPESHPKAQVRYSVKQEWLEASRDNYLIMPSGNLQIVNASQEDEGMYKCAAYNPVTQEVKTSGSSDRLRVRRSTAEAARIIYPPEAQTIVVTKGQSLILECVASGIPPPRVTWAKDGSSVASYNKTRFLLSNLLIDTTSEEDSGTYRCMADNGVGEPGAAVILYNVQVFEPPEVTMELSQLVIPWGQSAKLTCEVRGNPPPSVLWLRNAVPLTSSQRLRLSRRALRVVSMGPEDEGVYQCMAENEVGSAHAVVQLKTARPGTTLRPWWDAQSATVTPPVPPSRPGGPDQMPKGHPGLLRPQASEQPASPQCPGDQGPVAPAEAPIILSSPRTSKTDSYELVWRPRHEGSSRAPILYYVVKHRKQVTNSSDDWTISGIPASQHRLTLTRLDPGSLYEVEMAAYNCAGEGQTAMVTFRTGRRPKPEIVASKEQQIQRDDPGAGPQSSSQPDHGRLSPPEAPDRPTISMASETSVYVTWIPRGNGGFPIQSFRVEYKKLKKVGDWILATSAIPPSRLSVEITGLEKGTSYKFRVRALNMLGESEPSAPSRPYVVSGYSSRVYERPVAGPYITFTDAVNETTIMLKWMYIPASNNNTPIHGFYIYYRPTDSDNDSDYKKDMVEGDRYWHSISHLQPETSYDIKMQCFNEGGESEFSNVMICETKARKSSGQPGRLPPPTLAPPQPPPPETMERPVGTGAMVARSSDLPYLIVGVVLGSVVLIIVAFIPFCLWRAWSKQKHTTDLGFPRSALLSSSCQYTMVPLGGLPGHRATGQPYLSGTNGRACANGVRVNRACPVAAMGYPGVKPQQHCPGELQQALNPGLLNKERESYLDSDVTFSSLFEQQEDVNSVLRQTFLGNGYDPHSPQIPRAPRSNPDEGAFLYTLPDDSAHQLPPPHRDCHHLQEQPEATGQPGMRSVPQSPGLEAMWDPVFHPGPPCCLGLVPVEEVDSPDSCPVGRGDWCPQHPSGSYAGQELGVRLSPSPPVHVSFETPPPTI
ncbi:brother of CDO isoform X1 [Bubalus kerabau]|uniref:brother of CDO isoform X1 n=2 Tax=Bubalus TaxID=9918 RepID=UPI001D1302CF|nr:brother of CDO isoform X1 [Bubalus bubalis]XP_044797753.1 brother of CDO isoform X1 [Bubalus bubalis]XP_044797757.1 brother of CDO isoform X1 [Bubalus bubalis]XP_044797760.1 brother of CDO isoform X1 [Bubalus bubalis]XP_044797761.1 brother of CDO isoform X1 [Bubalus bubalis]XP_044797764.1 brother of CDO isoform X1 [Bubalus bubalis]XP_044797768.1 brother of CDO isoform X1 [Bubalus bubalis]XP_044797773.1 brother of CDO isoform X1 [Bubalus bubalis]XP_044797774.1 brother of CDO isoform X1 [B